MPRKAPSSTRRRAPAQEARAFADTPRILSEQEKHELIRVHVAARATHDPLQRASLWAGVTLSIAALLVGWWLTVGQNIKQSFADGSADLKKLTQELNTFSERVESDPTLRNSLLPSPTSNASASSFEAILKGNLAATTTRARDLLVPPTSNSSTAVPLSLIHI